MGRRKSRALAVQILYQLELNHSETEAALQAFWDNYNHPEEVREFSNRLVRGVAANRMQIDGEKACDSTVIDAGVVPYDYAGHIIDIARSTRGRVLSLMLQHSFGKRSSLEPRIRNILSLRKSDTHERLSLLIRTLAICFACLLVLHMVNPVSARHNGGLSGREAPAELLYGRWLNEEDYDPWKADPAGKFMAKLTVDPDGSIALYYTPTSLELPYTGINGFYTITDSYTDRRGNHLYKLNIGTIDCQECVKELWRIDPSGSFLEIAWDCSEYPSQIDPDSYEYFTFYRK